MRVERYQCVTRHAIGADIVRVVRWNGTLDNLKMIDRTDEWLARQCARSSSLISATRHGACPAGDSQPAAQGLVAEAISNHCLVPTAQNRTNFCGRRLALSTRTA
jgi:hypothetical protein